ncbi:RdRP-domain-containing protein [Artomyces pyxidatus]|uniref:RdRP-domain-containing protein n=1 Tax=Artomyces pyxidatus TaxID=48021 RepID=A0ACB8T1G8_9AGAM|nr:RdRP-domain-containing protein [Artomyces pyxidatus]
MNNLRLFDLRLSGFFSNAVEESKSELEGEVAAGIAIKMIQFGREMRDGRFTVEWEKPFSEDCGLSFGRERRELRIQILHLGTAIRSIVIPTSQIARSATDSGGAIFLSLRSAPVFETKSAQILPQLFSYRPAKRTRHTSLYPEDKDHVRILPYAALAIRLVTRTVQGLSKFRKLCKAHQLRASQSSCPPVIYLHRFTQERLDEYQAWLQSLDWPLAFQIEALVRGLVADVWDILSVRGLIGRRLSSKGSSYLIGLIRHLRSTLATSKIRSTSTFEYLFRRCEREYSQAPLVSNRGGDDGIFDSFHAIVTPTAMRLDGPLPERSNRIMRLYADNYDSFLRVSFTEETTLQYRHDREIDGPSFIAIWVRRILKDGLHIAGRHFRFLAYSQSALKSHTVWFVKDFTDSTGEVINAATIIARLGTFDNLQYDLNLLRCPARFAARISQAFTTTESSVPVKVDEYIVAPDIKSSDGSYNFTDGAGAVSVEMANAIWKKLQQRGKRGTRRALKPSTVFQVRFQGSKGVISVDYTLSGRVVVLRQSMIKFDAPHSPDMEIVQAFVRPSPFNLNRPVIMILEGLGVPYTVFKGLQDATIRDVGESAYSYDKAGNVLDQFGLGGSYRLSSIFLHMAKLGLSPTSADGFYRRIMRSAIHHILRDLKHHSRIPVPDGYTVVGVPDFHGYLEPDEIFVCVTDLETQSLKYLEGRVLITRSPVIHPGDVQVVHAIGAPPPDSPFAREPLAPSVVFSVKGDRPLPSYLGGGDLDGDLYNITTFQDLLPPKNYPPAAYKAAKRKYLDRPSTMEDVADFVADYINNDLLGMVATQWLLIADSEGIYSPDCLKLAQVHSDAVDFPKSGQPVSIQSVPRLKRPERPDWNAGEFVNLDESKVYYRSNKAIGRLFRDIDLTTSNPLANLHASWRDGDADYGDEEIGDILDDIADIDMEDLNANPLYSTVHNRVSRYIDTDTASAQPGEPPARLLLDGYTPELQAICASNALSRHRHAMLSEDEAIAGTIVAKCTQPRRRTDAMSQLRDQTSMLVKHIREEIEGDDDLSNEEWLRRAWAAWLASFARRNEFGAKSFGWIALGEIFDAMKAIEEEKQRLS